MSQNDQMATVPDDGPLPIRKQKFDEAHFDITAMIDLVFMMNIFFLVTTVTAALAEIDLPVAQHCTAADRDSAVMITIMAPPDRSQGLVFLDDDTSGEPLLDLAEQEQRVREAVEDGVRAGKKFVIIKAEKNVRLRDVSRVGRVAGGVPGADLRVSVLEKE